MGENSKIEWTHHTFNPWWGCEHVHLGCTHCYAETLAKRTGRAKWGGQGARARTSLKNWREPIGWNADALEAGERRRVFCASMADVFEEFDGEITDFNGRPFEHHGARTLTMDDMRRELFQLIDATPWLDWLLLTKRPENVRRMWPYIDPVHELKGIRDDPRRDNVWIGTSISDQATADTFVPRLLNLSDLASVLFLSIEPLLGPIALPVIIDTQEEDEPGNRDPGVREVDMGGFGARIDWVIAGGESGPKARPMHPDWVRGIRDQCVAAGVPFFFKQWGEWAPSNQIDPRLPSQPLARYKLHRFPGAEVRRFGKQIAGRRLDSVEWSQFPDRVPTNNEGAKDGA